jgi:FtsH-binding integral membrane protein
MSKSLAKLQSWMLWVAGVLAVLGSIGMASLPLQVLFLQANILMPIVGLLCLGSAFIVSERATIDEKDPSLTRRIRIWALLVLGIVSIATMLPVVSLQVQLPFAHLDMLMLLIGFGCLFFAYVGTKT